VKSLVRHGLLLAFHSRCHWCDPISVSGARRDLKLSHFPFCVSARAGACSTVVRGVIGDMATGCATLSKHTSIAHSKAQQSRTREPKLHKTMLSHMIDHTGCSQQSPQTLLLDRQNRFSWVILQGWILVNWGPVDELNISRSHKRYISGLEHTTTEEGSISPELLGDGKSLQHSLSIVFIMNEDWCHCGTSFLFPT
jgi:hypothetical protein